MSWVACWLQRPDHSITSRQCAGAPAVVPVELEGRFAAEALLGTPHSPCHLADLAASCLQPFLCCWQFHCDCARGCSKGSAWAMPCALSVAGAFNVILPVSAAAAAATGGQAGGHQGPPGEPPSGAPSPASAHAGGGEGGPAPTARQGGRWSGRPRAGGGPAPGEGARGAGAGRWAAPLSHSG